MKLPEIVKAVKAKQRKEGLDDTALAGRLGIDLSTWSRIKRGERQPGVKFLNGVMNRYPELSPLVSAYIANRNNHDKDIAPGRRP